MERALRVLDGAVAVFDASAGVEVISPFANTFFFSLKNWFQALIIVGGFFPLKTPTGSDSDRVETSREAPHPLCLFPQ